MSDTESEPDLHEIDPFLDHFHSLNLDASKTIATAIHDIQRIQVTDPQTIENDTELHAVIFEASSTIICFLDSVHTPNDEKLGDFGRLVDVAFLSALFEHRKIFNQVAAQSLAPGPSSAIVCWVDVILFKLGDAVVPIASGVSVDFSSPLFPATAEDSLRAASRLPSEWSSVMELVASDKASSAAKRLALRLSYAAFVLGPCLCPDNSPIQMPHSMEEILNRCVIQTRAATGFSASRAGDGLAIQERLNCAMIISLFAAANHRQVSHLRPHTLGSLLSILQDVLHPEDTVASLQLVAPPDALDPAQTILLRWGDTVSWCWETWDDHRVADAESIVFLTSMWLLHVSAPSFPLDAEESSCMNVSTASCIAILRVLHHIVSSFSTAYPALPSSVPLAVISQACFHSIESLNNLLSTKTEDERWIVCGICKYLLSLFVMVGDTNEEHCVDDYILEALSLIDADTLRVCLTQIQGDSVLRFSARLDERILRVKKSVTIDMAPDVRTLNFIRSALHFVIIIWFSQTPGCLLRQSISPVLSKILDLVSQESSTQLQSRILADALLTAFSAARCDPSWSDDSREVILHFVVRTTLPDLAIASSFADYITTSRTLCNPLSCAQAWRLLEDCLALILRNHYGGEQEPLALLVCPTICSALIRLLWADPASTRFMISTPFTLNLCADLKAVCDGARSGQYFDVMKERLGVLGPRLLDQILRKSRNEDLPELAENTPKRLIFYRMHGLSHLVFIPDV